VVAQVIVGAVDRDQERHSTPQLAKVIGRRRTVVTDDTCNVGVVRGAPGIMAEQRRVRQVGNPANAFAVELAR